MFNTIKKLFVRTDAHRVAFVGLSPEGGRDAGGQFITYFGIPVGRELDAGHDVVACLIGGAEVSLGNSLDEGHEGTTSFRRVGSGLETKVGGHGWQGDWKPIDEAGILVSVAALAPLNRGGHWSKQVSVARSKRPA